MQIPSYSQVEPLIRLALDEDIGSGDITSNALFEEYRFARARIFAKSNGVFCGGFIIHYIYSTLDAGISVTLYREEGAEIHYGDEIADIEGNLSVLLSGERVVLNFLQRMCGIATLTQQYVQHMQGTNIKILDTRKTIPGFRILDKYAVYCGGGTNHRMGLYDMILIKDNHIHAVGGISKAVAKVRQKYGNKYTVEVEASTLSQVQEAVEAGADIIMLDNMPVEDMRIAVSMIGGRAKIEVSGNINEDSLASLRDLPIDYISVGALTHSVKAFDLSMKLL